MAQNKDCYESGIVCMKYLLIYVGLTKIYFSDNSGKPVSTRHNHLQLSNGTFINYKLHFQLSKILL